MCTVPVIMLGAPGDRRLATCRQWADSEIGWFWRIQTQGGTSVCGPHGDRVDLRHSWSPGRPIAWSMQCRSWISFWQELPRLENGGSGPCLPPTGWGCSRHAFHIVRLCSVQWLCPQTIYYVNVNLDNERVAHALAPVLEHIPDSIILFLASEFFFLKDTILVTVLVFFFPSNLYALVPFQALLK